MIPRTVRVIALPYKSIRRFYKLDMMFVEWATFSYQNDLGKKVFFILSN
jgi:hypothetical protein